jgi:hypothetical protein
VAKEDHDDDWFWRPNVVTALDVTPQAQAAQGVIVDVQPQASPPGCEDRLARLQEAGAT